MPNFALKPDWRHVSELTCYCKYCGWLPVDCHACDPLCTYDKATDCAELETNHSHCANLSKAHNTHLTRAASDCLLVSYVQILSHYPCQEMLHDHSQNCARCLWNGFLHSVATHIANQYTTSISTKITPTLSTNLMESLIRHPSVSINLQNHCPISELLSNY